jgi:hypothetical protein
MISILIGVTRKSLINLGIDSEISVHLNGDVMAQKMYRQGDLLFIRIEKLPRKNRLMRIKSNVILRGEATGHSHRLVGGSLYATQRVGQTADLYIEVDKAAEVVHEEHAPLKLEPGYWRVLRQREYTPDGYGGVDFVID